MPGVVDQKPATGTNGTGADAGIGVDVDGGVGDIRVGAALGSAIELGSDWKLRTAPAGRLGSIVAVGTGFAPATTMATTKSPPLGRRTICHTRTGAA